MPMRATALALLLPAAIALRGSVLSLVDQKTKSKVVLVGTVHFNPSSIKLAEQTVREAAADGALHAVAVESCPRRWDKTIEQQPVGSPLRSLLDNEMQAAAEAGAAFGAETVLVDQCINTTASRLVRLAGQTLVELATPWNGGWARIADDIRQGYDQVVASGSAGPLDGGIRVLERAVQPSLLAGAPVALGRYLLAFAVTSPALGAALLATLAFYAVYFGDDGYAAYFGELWSIGGGADTAPLATVGGGEILVDARAFVAFQLLQWLVYSRVFLVGLLAERNRVIAANIRRQCEIGGADSTVVGVVGMAHLDGVRALLLESCIEESGSG